MIIADPRPMSSAPFDGTPVRLFVFAGCAIASFWSEERSQKAFGPGDYRAGWYLLDDDAVELDEPMGWEPLAGGCPVGGTEPKRKVWPAANQPEAARPRHANADCCAANNSERTQAYQAAVPSPVRDDS
jgi:hypothetical protein